jgi:S1-C subfamily serine protease
MNGTSVRNPETRGLLGLALIAGVTLALPGGAWPQVDDRQTVEQALGLLGRDCDGPSVGTLGVAQVDCGGRCALTLRARRGDLSAWTPEWFFSVEPRIARIAPNSPASGVLEVGDRIVAVDGFLITTSAGGRRFGSPTPESTVTVRYRRDGRTLDASLRATRRCGPGVEGAYGIAFPAAVVDSLTGQVEFRMASGLAIQSWSAADGRRTVITIPGLETHLGRSGTRPRDAVGSYGMSFSCGPCSQTIGGARQDWRFSNPIQVMRVDEGGPADVAGLRVGDWITHVNGVRLDTRRGGEIFSRARPGERMEFTVTRDGRERTVTLVPRGRD